MYVLSISYTKDNFVPIIANEDHAKLLRLGKRFKDKLNGNYVIDMVRDGRSNIGNPGTPVVN